MNEYLAQMKVAIYEDGVIDEGEVKMLRDYFAKHGLGEEEARFVIDLNNLMSDCDRPQSFDDLFVEQLTALMLAADKRVSAEKWQWLKDNLLKDDLIDALERRLIKSVCDGAVEVPAEMRQMVG